MAKRRDTSLPEQSVPVPDWARDFGDGSRWRRKGDDAQPAGLDWIAPWRWQEMQGHKRWNAARRKWLSEHRPDLLPPNWRARTTTSRRTQAAYPAADDP